MLLETKDKTLPRENSTSDSEENSAIKDLDQHSMGDTDNQVSVQNTIVREGVWVCIHYYIKIFEKYCLKVLKSAVCGFDPYLGNE